jgi:perosamine synthetase
VVNSVLYVGATPVVVDVDPVTWNIDAREVLKVLSKNTKAIIAVDNYGKSNNFNLLRKLLPSYIYLIQDAAESFPGFNKDQYLSEQGDLTIMSFYANKIITAGEGGAIFAHKNLIDRINILKNQAQVLNMNFVHGEVGYNYRISNLHAAVFNAQWSKLKKLQRARSKIYQNYLNELNTRNIKFSTNIDDFSARWLFTIKLLHFKNDIQFIRNYLKENGIETRPGFTPYSSLAYLQDKCVFTGSYKNSVELFNNTISLPTYPGLKIKQIKFIITKLCEVIEK